MPTVPRQVDAALLLPSVGEAAAHRLLHDSEIRNGLDCPTQINFGVVPKDDMANSGLMGAAVIFETIGDASEKYEIATKRGLLSAPDVGRVDINVECLGRGSICEKHEPHKRAHVPVHCSQTLAQFRQFGRDICSGYWCSL